MARNRAGAWTMVLGFVLLGVVPVFVKLAKLAGVSAPETVAARFLLACVLVPAAARWYRQPLVTKNRPLLVVRGVLGAIAVLLFFTSVQLAGAGPGTLLNYTYPVWANLFAVVLGERPKKRFWVWLGLALLGVYLVIDPSVGAIGTGEVAGLTSGVFAGAAVLCIKRLRETDGELVIIASFSVIGLLLSLPLALWSTTSLEVWFGPSTIAILLGVGALSFFGHVYFTRGYKHTTIQLGTVLSLLVPVIAALSGWLFLDEPLTPTFLVGGAMILVACAALGLSERATPKGS